MNNMEEGIILEMNTRVRGTICFRNSASDLAGLPSLNNTFADREGFEPPNPFRGCPISSRVL